MPADGGTPVSTLCTTGRHCFNHSLIVCKAWFVNYYNTGVEATSVAYNVPIEFRDKPLNFVESTACFNSCINILCNSSFFHIKFTDAAAESLTHSVTCSADMWC